MKRLPFSEHLVRVNRLEQYDFACWVFEPGMRFGAREQWWGKRGLRPTPHEGIDLCRFADSRGELHQLNQKIRIPAPADGRVESIQKDFLGQSIFILHPQITAAGKTLFSAFGHTRPKGEIKAGQEVTAGQVIACLADPGPKRPHIRAHLHISTGWLDPGLSLADFNWERLAAGDGAILVDPLDCLDCPF